jgi:hypothetical protein
MRFAHSLKRPAFSLMEMMLALTLGMILLLALYFTLSTYFFNAQAGRDIVAEATLARNILNRVSSDITSQIGAVDKRGLVDPAAAAAPAAPATDPAAPATDPAAAANPMAAQPTLEPVLYNRGITGRADSLVLSNFRVQKPRLMPDGSDASTEIVSDLRQTAYWLVMNGPDVVGLARAELKQATSTDVDLDPKDLPEQEKYVIAKEVKNVVFEYLNGVNGQWQADWDGSAGGDESGAATGPPAAIRITLTLKRTVRGVPVTDGAAGDGPTYQIVVAIPASNSFPPPATN